MTKSTSPDSQKDDPTARFHAILDGDKEDEPARPPKPSRSILDRLPRAPKPASPPVTGCQTVITAWTMIPKARVPSMK